MLATGCAPASSVHAGLAPVRGGLRPNVAPGGNFDLSHWELQEPIGTPGHPATIDPSKLQGADGFHDSYFFTASDGAMTFWDPENGITTDHSEFPRSELREVNADGSPANWPIAGTNILRASLAVTRVPDRVCIGQIHLGAPLDVGVVPSTKPLLELYYSHDGNIDLGIERSPRGGQTLHAITSTPLGSIFTYVIELTPDGTITLTLNGATSTFTIPPSFAGYGAYFKAGNYDQSVGTDATVGATVKFYALQIESKGR
jgi:hypothetical protein